MKKRVCCQQLLSVHGQVAIWQTINQSICFFQPSSVHSWTSSLLSTGRVVPLRGNWAIFCHAGSGWVGRVWSPREKSLEILTYSWKPNPGHREDSQWDSFILPLSYLDWFVLPLYIVCLESGITRRGSRIAHAEVQRGARNLESRGWNPGHGRPPLWVWAPDPKSKHKQALLEVEGWYWLTRGAPC